MISPLREPHKIPNVERLLRALYRWPGITEIALADAFSPGDFFALSELQRQGMGVRGPLSWTHRIPEAIRTAEKQGLIRCVPTSHPDYTSYFATGLS